MSNIYLGFVYKQLFGEDFSYDQFAHRLKMQKGIYLLNELGISVGDYNFSWYKHGPYSQALLDDSFATNIQDTEFAISTDARLAIRLVRDMLRLPAENTVYDDAYWAECLASLHYLKYKVMPSSTPDDLVCEELESQKTHLSERKLNLEALARLKRLFPL